jgi:hypothetical protein
MRLAPLALLALSTLPALTQPADPPLDDTLYAGYRDAIAPRAEEERWRAIPWRTSYWEAVKEGNQAGKPVFLWTMNGHPLACT